MIQLFTQADMERVLQIEAEHPQLIKIQALLQAYGIGYDFCRFYRQQEDGRDTGYLFKLDDSGVLWTEEDADIGEWSDFFGMIGLSEVSAVGRTGCRLQKECPVFGCQSGNIFVKHNSLTETSVQSVETTSLTQVFAVICRCFPNLTTAQFDGWYCDLSHRIRHGVCKAFLYRESAAAIVLSYGQTAIISQFCVLPEYRRNRVGRNLMQAIESVYSGKKLVVFSKDSLSDSFYGNIGFLPAERWFTFYR
ncbi:MAG: GNAT family N-acetyltransferase [Clostridiales bacterium]|nr:GNAT family N-acetyltransferase [Clostridiales bacterium]